MRPTPQRRAVATGALVAVTAMLAVGVQTTSANAGQDKAAQPAPRQSIHKPDPGAEPVKLSPSQRAELIRDANATKAETAKNLGLGAKEKLVVKDVVKDRNGTLHTRYERTYDGLPVLGGDLVVDATKSGQVKTAAKATKQRIAVATTTPSLAASAAEKDAVKAARAKGSKADKADKAPRKVVWAANGKPLLAYETVVGGVQDDGTPSQLHVITDAKTGKKLFEFQGVKQGTGNSQHSGQVTIGTTKSGSSYQMYDTTRGGHKTYNLNHGSSGTGTLFTDSDDVWGNGTNSDPATAGVDAHYGAQLTWDYYKNVHGRNGIRGDGVGAYSRVHYGNNYVNAFWDDSCFCMTYGDGNGIPLTSIDVAAHEMTHGVTSATANLTYSGESGGLNEATSDIMATAVEFWANNPADPGDYLIGEKININGDGTPLRYQDKPSRDGASKDAWYSGLGGIDVHYSSGPANHWFYLASEGSGPKDIGGVHYDSPTSDGLPVTGIGRDNAAKIWFKALTERMQSNTDYKGARDATLWAAGELFGVNSDTYNNVANAWAAINVGPRASSGVSVTSPGDQTSIVNQAVSLQIKATGSTSGALTYSATGLPAGLSINASTGLISGTPTATGTSNVTVTVKDSAGKTGSTSFKWTVNTTGGGSVFENTTQVAIPDAGAAVTSPIVVTRSGNGSSALKVDVNITHTYRGDLTIDLVAPNGKTWRLKNSDAWDSAADVSETYTVDASSVSANGTWKLKVQDVYSGDSGTIDKWRLTF
ncbi:MULTISPECIES: M4 family metallopeptidase [Streptomyces]|uniref:M4 family metallopeptidase n=1 Tax=Streptomyces TaxID=1883 RepID=UPI00163C178D|nr:MULTISPECIES: M4 family metallopeptidase [Streptomyces]MBC2874518.1 M4 family metallopeptidase [Streptomyces sp. TYQ1024]UBI36709.1 M4 family metallopeptidase [Streptomyces mobaraensis]UKW29301.1 M4 family metallopeptidase [Streptomyces sp. TYQ1024]